MPFGEFVALMATMTALIALSIDMLLPALPAIGAALGVQRANDTQLIVSLLFLGFGFGQFFYGPISESVGRKPAVYVGLALFSAGCVLALVAQSLPMMLVGRILQGVGVGGPRAMTIALVRDKFEGRAMARVMSLVMAVFILVPVVAPTIGQAILGFAGWRMIFTVYLTLGLTLWVWFAWRQEETLKPARRRPLSPGSIVHGATEVVTNRLAFGYTVAAGLVYGAFIGYLSSVQQILQQLYALGPRFPLYFATLAIALGGASLSNARLVGRYGMRHLAGLALTALCIISVLFVGLVARLAGHPPLLMLIAYLLASFFGIGLLYGNLQALAMQPLGHIAGIGAAVVGGSSTLISLACGTVIGQSYDNTVLPLVGGFAVLSALSMAVIRFAEFNVANDPEQSALGSSASSVALVLEETVQADVGLGFAWNYRTDVTKWNDPPARFELDGPFVDGARGTTFLPGQEPLTWRVRDVKRRRSFTIEMILTDAVLHFEWHFAAVSERQTKLTQRIVLAGPNAAAYTQQVQTGFGANLAAGMQRIAREMALAVQTSN
jgi:DHA1 family bicyclomycin/chloramphenicol resistance-like MFS transporter